MHKYSRPNALSVNKKGEPGYPFFCSARLFVFSATPNANRKIRLGACAIASEDPVALSRKQPNANLLLTRKQPNANLFRENNECPVLTRKHTRTHLKFIVGEEAARHPVVAVYGYGGGLLSRQPAPLEAENDRNEVVREKKGLRGQADPVRN